MKAEVMNWLFIIIGFIIVIALYIKYKKIGILTNEINDSNIIYKLQNEILMYL